MKGWMGGQAGLLTGSMAGGLSPSEEPQGAGGPWAAQDTARVQPAQPLPWGHCRGVMAHYNMAHMARAGDTPARTGALISVAI